MPTILTHAVAGAGVGLLVVPVPSVTFVAVSMGLRVLPDVDVVGFYLGVPYRSLFGHRGLSHSLLCAAVVGVPVGFLCAGYVDVHWALLGLAFFLAMASHALLDAFTNGGLGVAFFAPFDNSRYFLPWRPIEVSMIGLHFDWRVLASELRWVWLPLAVLLCIRVLGQGFG